MSAKGKEVHIMFKTQFEKFLEEAKSLSDHLYDLNRSIDDNAMQIKQEETIQHLMKHQGEQLKSKVLELNPLTKTGEVQKEAEKKINELRDNLFTDTLALSRDQFLNKICRLQLNLHTLSSLAQSSLIENLELKENANNRAVLIKFGRLKDHISEITEDDLVDTLKHLLDAHQFLTITLGDGLSVTMGLMFAPDNKTPAEVATSVYKIRAALHTDNAHYQRFKGMSEALSDSKAFASFYQFMDDHPSSRHLSKKLLADIKPIMEEIEATHSKALETYQSIISTIEDARSSDFKQIMSQKQPK